MSFRLHKFVLALCVTLCLAVALWPRQPKPVEPPRVLVPIATSVERAGHLVPARPARPGP